MGVMASTKLKTSDYVHLHNHTQYSLLDGLTKIPALIDAVKEMGMNSIAITDHGTLSGAIEFYTTAKENGIKVKYILITRENSNVGWKLRDLAIYYNIPAEVMIFERGMAFKKLFLFYTMADAYLLTSKGEGLCEPVLEAMSVGVPVVATACGSLPELLGTEYEWQRGFLMETAYPIPGDDMIDPWGNETRIFPKVSSGVQALETVYRQFTTSPLVCVTRARNYVETRTWDKPIQQLMDAMEKLKCTNAIPKVYNEANS